jgi:hypothetical protein
MTTLKGHPSILVLSEVLNCTSVLKQTFQSFTVVISVFWESQKTLMNMMDAWIQIFSSETQINTKIHLKSQRAYETYFKKPSALKDAKWQYTIKYI